MEKQKHPQALTARDGYIPGAFAVLKIVLHLAVLGRYGIFRDEFYYLACARHLDWGYVDHPPLSIALLAAWTGIFGDGVWALRLPAILVGALVVFMTGLLTRALGGGRFAQALACLAVVIAPLFLAIANFYSMNVFDQCFSLLLAFILVRFLQSENPRYWIGFGLVAGLGLENKISVLFLGFGVVIALLLTAHRRVFLKKELWIGGALAALLLVPYGAWQLTHDGATFEFMHNATTLKNTPTTPLQLFLGTILEMHPMNALVWLAGLAYALGHPEGKRYRVLGLCFLVVFFTFAFSNGKVYYLAPIMPMMLALGAVAWETWTRRVPRWRYALVVPMVVSGVLLLPMSLPLLSPAGFVTYQQGIGLAPTKMERSALGALPQHFADRFGWEELAVFIEEHYRDLAPEDGPPLPIVVNNYGEAGALEYYARTHRLPRPVTGHNNYFVWGPGAFSGDLFLAYGLDRDDLERFCVAVEEVGRFHHPLAMPHQRDRPLFVCRGLKRPIDEVWPFMKAYI